MTGQIQWNQGDTVDSLLMRLDIAADEMNSFLEENELGDTTFIDEVALVTPNLLSSHRFLLRALEEGVGIANFFAVDNVHTMPILGEYEANYLFFQPNKYRWRLEIMNIEHGFSPVHSALEVGRQLPCAVHASFKCPDLASYGRFVEQLYGISTVHHAQTCNSTYGAFSYWLVESSVEELQYFPLYLKPRVNLRDQR